MLQFNQALLLQSFILVFQLKDPILKLLFPGLQQIIFNLLGGERISKLLIFLNICLIGSAKLYNYLFIRVPGVLELSLFAPIYALEFLKGPTKESALLHHRLKGVFQINQQRLVST